MPAEPFSSGQSDLSAGGQPSMPAEAAPAQSAPGALYLAKRAVHAILCIAIPLGIWALIIRWSTESVVQPSPDSLANPLPSLESGRAVGVPLLVCFCRGCQVVYLAGDFCTTPLP